MSNQHIENLQNEVIKQDIKDRQEDNKAKTEVVAAAGEAAIDGAIASQPGYSYVDLTEREPAGRHELSATLLTNKQRADKLAEDISLDHVELQVPSHDEDALAVWSSMTDRVLPPSKLLQTVKGVTYKHCYKPQDATAEAPAEVVFGGYGQGIEMEPMQVTLVRRADIATTEGLTTSAITLYRGIPEEFAPFLQAQQ